jgi:DNA-binding IclR family transcriptional regulator
VVDGNIILSVAKAMELLQILSQAGKPLLLKELTALCGYPKSTVFGLLTTMRAYDVVTQTPDGRYTLGLRLVERSWDISTVARPYMEHLCRQTGVSVMLSVCEGGSVITLDQVETRGSLRVVSDTGSRLPIYCTSQGKVFLAHMSRTGAEALLRGQSRSPPTPLPISPRCCGRWRRAAPTATPSRTASTRSACVLSPRRSTPWRVRCSTRWA